jgi:tRNA-(ms[2]io[6]A)-hydroxylase
MLCLTRPSGAHWVAAALGDLDALLADHAHCEMKAASNALALAGRAVSFPSVLRALIDVAEEEMAHFRLVLAELDRRKIALGPPSVDTYVAELRRLPGTLPSRFRGREQQAGLVDRLLVAALIEARSCERFRLLGGALDAKGEPSLARFYRDLLAAEARHFATFVELSIEVGGDEPLVRARLGDLAAAEGELTSRLAGAPTIHG